MLFDVWDFTLKWSESLPWLSLIVRFILEWYSKDTVLEVPPWFLFLPLVCLASTHPWRTPLSLIWQSHEPEICCQLSTLGKLLYHLKSGRLDRNGLGIYILLLPNLPVSPFASSQPCPCCCYCLNGDSVLKLLLGLPEKKHHPWSQQTGDKRKGQVGCSLELKKKEHVIIKQTSSLLQLWSFLGPFYCFYHGQRCLVCSSQVFSNSQCSVSEDKLVRKWAPFD